LDNTKCVKCKDCIDACSYGVIEWLEDMPIVANPNDCALYLEYEKKCCVDAIEHEEK
jgi:Fe-S-cluster-containing hydrogenase component 2